MNDRKYVRALSAFLALSLCLSLAAGCATVQRERQPYQTKRDKTLKGAGVGAAAGAVGAILAGKREADEILAGAAIGGAIGAGVGAYMDAQEEKIARIPNTTVERESEDTLLVHFDSDILFDVDSWAVDADGRATLAEVADVLVQYPKTAVVVQGHTDSTGSEEHNQALSERRASSVRNFLAAEGVAAERMATLGFGESAPVASNENESGRRLNRRVDILLKARA